MSKSLIPVVVCALVSLSTALCAQSPKSISTSTKVIPIPPSLTSAQSEAGCGNAGTFTLGPIVGQSNDGTGPQLFLCLGDQVNITHNGDFDLSGDPVSTTPAAVSYAFYTCPPTVDGPTLANILGDNCVADNTVPLPPAGGIWVADVINPFQAAGNQTFSNLGGMQNLFNTMGLTPAPPVEVTFAAITLDYWNPTDVGFEGSPAGPCVDINQQDAFSVVYLNPISISNQNDSVQGNPCIGSFRVRGGASEFLGPASLYTIDIQKQPNGPGKEAVLATKLSTHFHQGINPTFHVSQPGTYVINVEDGKSCGTTFSMDMSGCVPAANMTLISGSQTVLPNQTICIPITVKNFKDITSLQASVHWCTNNFQYVSHAASAALPDIIFNPNEVNTLGSLGLAWFDAAGIGNNLPDNTVIFTLCLKAIGALGSCCPIEFTSDVAAISCENSMGDLIGISVEEGQVCITTPATVLCDINVTSNCSSAGAFTVTATGGSDPYSVSANSSTGVSLGPQSFAAGETIEFNGLSTGDYVVTVTDNAGSTCTKTISIATLAVTDFESTNPSCFGLKDGTVNVKISNNGVAVPSPGSDFTFLWNINPNPGTPMVTGLGAGSYAVTVTNTVSGCTDVASGSIDAPNALNIFQKTDTDASCTGIANGAFGFNVFGGNGGNSAQIVGPGGPNTISTFPFSKNNALAGTYYISVMDSKGCTDVDSITVDAQKEYDLDSTVDGVLCAGQNTGKISATLTTNPSGGVIAPLTWNWSSGIPTNMGTSSTVTGLLKGVVTLTVMDATGCGVMKVFDVPENAKLVARGTITQPPCTGVVGGSINLNTSSGGAGPATYTYNWNPAQSPSGPTANNLPPGLYVVTITDGNGCTAVFDTTLLAPNPPMIAVVSAVDPKCFNSTNGKIDINSTEIDPNTKPFTFKWSNNVTTEDLNNVACGIYTLVVTDTRLCSSTASVTLNCPPAIEIIDVQKAAPTCFGDNDGSLTITAGGGTGILTYSWSPLNPPTPTVTGAAGIYKLTLTDSQQCSLTTTDTIPAAPSINITISNQKDAKCALDQSCDGAATAAAAYSSGPAATFNYVWTWGTPPTNFNGATVTSLCEGAVKVVATDPAKGCTAEKTIQIGAPALLTLANLISQPPTCNGGCDAVLSATAAGGTTPYTFNWTIITATGPTTATGTQITNACAGNVLLKITDANGCEYDETLPSIPQPGPVEVFVDLANTADVQCAGLQNGQIGWLVTGGNGNFSYQYSPAIGTTNPVLNLAAGTYMVTATDQKGCSGTATHQLTEPGPIFFSLAAFEAIKCFGEETNIQLDTAFGGNGPDFLYDVDQTGFIPLSLDTRINGGEHVITVQDSKGCIQSDTIDIAQPDEIIVGLGPDFEIELGDTTRQLNPQFNIQIDSFVWFPTLGLAAPTDLRPFLQNLTTTTYTLTIFDANGCSGMDAIIVDVDPNRKVFIPNIFKPGTSLSDHFRVFVGNGVKTVNFMRVYDRWGALMYQLDAFYPANGDYSEGWDGTFNGKNSNPGVYVYVVEVEFLDGRTLLYRGDVTLAR